MNLKELNELRALVHGWREAADRYVPIGPVRDFDDAWENGVYVAYTACAARLTALLERYEAEMKSPVVSVIYDESGATSGAGVVRDDA